MRTAWPATRPAHSFLEFRAYPFNVLPSGFRFLDGDNPADPLVAREWRNILPFGPRNGIGNENLSQIWWYIVYRARGDGFLGHGLHFPSLRIDNPPLHKGTDVPRRPRLRLREGWRDGGLGFQEFGEGEDGLDDGFFANGSVEHEVVQVACGPFDMEVALDEIHALLVDTVY